jgi:hypothetical protein
MTSKPRQRKSYKLPEQSIPGVSYSDHLSDIISLRIIFDRLGIRTQNTRIERYHNYLEAIINQDESAKSKIFKGIKNYEFDNDLDRQLYVTREIHELMWILRGLKVHMPKGIEDKLNEIVGGRDFAALDSNSASRNTQFELRIASYFCQKKYKVDLSTETDIVASKCREVYFVECKRVASEKLFIRRINDSRKQIDLRLPRDTWNKKHFAMMAIDITKLAFSHNGLTFGHTGEQTKDIIQDKLIKISNEVDSSKCFGDNRNILLLWLQIHIPALVVYPPTVISRFSSLAIVNSEQKVF